MRIISNTLTRARARQTICRVAAVTLAAGLLLPALDAQTRSNPVPPAAASTPPGAAAPAGHPTDASPAATPAPASPAATAPVAPAAPTGPAALEAPTSPVPPEQAQAEIPAPMSATQTAPGSATPRNWTNDQILTATVHQAWILSGKDDANFFEIVRELAEISASNRNVTLPDTPEAGRRAGAFIKAQAKEDHDALLYDIVDKAVRMTAIRQGEAASAARTGSARAGQHAPAGATR